MKRWFAPLFAAALLGANSNVGATPRQAAQNFIVPKAGGTVAIQKINVDADYALAYFSGGVLEGRDYHYLLLEKFSFGWQAIEAPGEGTGDCDFKWRGLSKSAIDALTAGMPFPHGSGRCGDESKIDIGPQDDVAELRLLSRTNLLVPIVKVAGPFGAVSWYGAGGGVGYWAKVNGDWHHVVGGGGALGVNDLMPWGVPLAAACVIAADTSHRCTPTVSMPPGDVSDEIAIVDLYYGYLQRAHTSQAYALLAPSFRKEHSFAWFLEHAKNPHKFDQIKPFSNNVVVVKLGASHMALWYVNRLADGKLYVTPSKASHLAANTKSLSVNPPIL